MSKETLLEWTSGEGHVRHRDGTAVGTRHYDVEVWQHGDPDSSAGRGQAQPLPTILKVAIDFSDAERQEFANKGTGLVLVTEDGRQIQFSVRPGDGTIIPQPGGLNRPRPRRAPRLMALLGLAGLLYLVTRSGIGSWLLSFPYALPVALVLIATAVVAVGKWVAPRSREPGYFMFGVVVVAIGVISLYAFPILTLLVVKKVGWPDELGGILAVLSIAVGGTLLIGGGWAAISTAWR